MFLKFPFEYAEIEGLGRLFYPIVRLQLKTIYGYQDFDFLVDTGADVTTLPIHILPVLGINKNKCKTNYTLGVGGIKVKTYEFLLPLKFGKLEFSVTASAVDAGKNSMPLLLGRKDVFEAKFNLILDSKQKVVIIKGNI
jgi:hypothetical protein